MSKKEQKLKKNLYKALTEYFIHNPKNNLTSSESFLDQLAAFRMEATLPIAIKHDPLNAYAKTNATCKQIKSKMIKSTCFIHPVESFLYILSFPFTHFSDPITFVFN